MSFSRASTGRHPTQPPPRSPRTPLPTSSSSYFDIYGRRTHANEPPPLPTRPSPLLATPKPTRDGRPTPRVVIKTRESSTSVSPVSSRSTPSRPPSSAGGSTTSSSSAIPRAQPTPRASSSSLSPRINQAGPSRPPPSPVGSSSSSSSRLAPRSSGTPPQRPNPIAGDPNRRKIRPKAIGTGSRPSPLPALALNPRTSSLPTNMNLLARTLSSSSRSHQPDRVHTRSPSLGPPTPTQTARPESPIYDRFTSSPSPPLQPPTPRASSGSPIARPHPLKALILVPAPPTPSSPNPSASPSLSSTTHSSKSSSSRRSILVEPPTPPARKSSMQAAQNVVLNGRERVGSKVSREGALSGMVVEEAEAEEERRSEEHERARAVEGEKEVRDCLKSGYMEADEERRTSEESGRVEVIQQRAEEEERGKLKAEGGSGQGEVFLRTDQEDNISRSPERVEIRVKENEGMAERKEHTQPDTPVAPPPKENPLDVGGSSTDIIVNEKPEQVIPANAAVRGTLESVLVESEETTQDEEQSEAGTPQPAQIIVSQEDQTSETEVRCLSSTPQDLVVSMVNEVEQREIPEPPLNIHATQPLDLPSTQPWHVSDPSPICSPNMVSQPDTSPILPRDPPNIPTQAGGSMTPPRTPSPPPLAPVPQTQTEKPQVEKVAEDRRKQVPERQEDEVVVYTPALTLTSSREIDMDDDRETGEMVDSPQSLKPQVPDEVVVTGPANQNRNSFLAPRPKERPLSPEFKELHTFPRATDNLLGPCIDPRLSWETDKFSGRRSGSGSSGGRGNEEERRERRRKREERRKREMEEAEGYGKGNDEIVTSVSTDLMDSFIDEFNPKAKSKPVWRAPDEITLDSDEDAKAKQAASASPRRRRRRKPSHQSSSPSDSDGPGATMPWKRVGKERYGHARTLSKPSQTGSEDESKTAPPSRQSSLPAAKRSREATAEELRAIALELGGKDMSRPQILYPKPSTESLSIDDIIKRHASASPHAFGLNRMKTPEKDRILGISSPSPSPVKTPTKSSPYSSRPSRSNLPAIGSPESIREAAQRSHLLLEKLQSVEEGSESGPVTPSRRSVEASGSGIYRTTSGHSRRPGSISVKSSTSVNSGSSWDTLKRAQGTESPSNENSSSLSSYLRSHRLTRLITLKRSRQMGQVMSLADVGDPDGYPVLVFLGLGCVRYLIALFDELARTLNIRLICIDRWGLGKSTDVSDDRRGMVEWAYVVEEVMDQLKLERFGILAHSAGAPYALATALKLKNRILGKIHLLAPWVNIDVDGGYKWLKYVPSGVIKTAQATEWKLQGWMLGKLPRTPTEAIGHNAQAARTFDPSSGSDNSNPADPAQPSQEESEDSDFSLIQEYSNLEDFQQPKLERSSTIEGLPTRQDRPDSRASSAVGLRSESRASYERSLPDTPRPSGSGRRDVYPIDGESHRDSPSVSEVFSKPTSYKSSSPRRADSLSVTSVPTQPTRSPTPSSIAPSTATRPETPFFVTLLQASHAEALAGGTSDLLAVLGKGSKPWGFSYKDVPQPCKIWFGDRDDKISEKGMRWMEKEMYKAELIVLKGEGHNLMMSAGVMMAVLESLSQDGKGWGSLLSRGTVRR